MMEQTKIVQLLITILCCGVVAGMNVPINPNAETGASTQNHVIRGNDQRRVRSISTNNSPFVCADGSGFINRTRLCNGRIDCLDSSDENSKLCNGTSCMNTFPCLNGQCIGLDSFCDGFSNCGDNSDEDLTLCAQPGSSKGIKCGNGQVLMGLNITCNGVYNCMDKSDEFNCSKCPGQLMCDKGYRCVKREAICNRIQDCFDGADESCFISDNQRCNVGNFICPTGKCATDKSKCSSTYSSTYDATHDWTYSLTYDSTHDSTYTSYSYTKVAAGVSVPGGVVIFVGGCFGYRRRRMRAITRTTRTTTATVAVITTTAVASDLPPPYAQVVEASAPSEGIVNPAFASSASVYK